MESNHIDLTSTHFILDSEGEDGMQYSVIFSKKKEVIIFEIDESDNIELKFVKDLKELEQLKSNNPIIKVALA